MFEANGCGNVPCGIAKAFARTVKVRARIGVRNIVSMLGCMSGLGRICLGNEAADATDRERTLERGRERGSRTFPISLFALAGTYPRSRTAATTDSATARQSDHGDLAQEASRSSSAHLTSGIAQSKSILCLSERENDGRRDTSIKIQSVANIKAQASYALPLGDATLVLIQHAHKVIPGLLVGMYKGCSVTKQYQYSKFLESSTAHRLIELHLSTSNRPVMCHEKNKQCNKIGILGSAVCW